MKKFWMLAALALLVTMIPGAARAQTVTISAQLNFNNEIHISHWNNVRVTVKNSGSTDIQGLVEVRYLGPLQREVFIEQGKELTLDFFLPPVEVGEFLQDSYRSEVDVVLMDRRDRVLASTVIRFDPWSRQLTQNIGVLSDAPGSYQRLANLGTGIEIARLEHSHFDNPIYMRSFPVIIFSDVGTLTLSAEQKQNIADWVRSGGILVLGGGGSWQQNQALVPPDLLPLLGQNLTVLDSLATTDPLFSFPVDDGEQYPVLTGTLQGEVVAAAGQPLLVARRVGNGMVLQSTLDLETAPFDNPINFEAFWSYVLTSVTGDIQTDSVNLDYWGLTNLLNLFTRSEMSLGGLTPIRMFLGFLAYILILGPINFFILFRLKRLDWAWLTVPLAAVIFTVGIFAVGSGSRSADRILYQISILHMNQDGQALADSYAGLYIPRRGRIELESSWRNVAASKANIVQPRSNGSDIILPNAPMWSIQRFVGTEIVPVTGNIAFIVSREGSQTSLTVTNNLEGNLFESYLILGQALYPVGPIDAGETKTIVLPNAVSSIGLDAILAHYNLDLAAQNQHYYAPHYGDWLRINSGMAMVGFTDLAVAPILGPVEQVVALDVIISSQDISQIVLVGDSVDIPDYWLTPTLSIQAAQSPYYDKRHFIEGKGHVDMIFNLPHSLDPAQGSWSLNFDGLWGEATGKLSVWSTAESRWIELGDLSSFMDRKTSLPLTDVEALAGHSKIIFRIEFEGMLTLGNNDVYISLKGGGLHD